MQGTVTVGIMSPQMWHWTFSPLHIVAVLVAVILVDVMGSFSGLFEWLLLLMVWMMVVEAYVVVVRLA